MVDSAKLAVDIDRLYETIAASAQIGTTATTGLSRAALTDADKQMRDLFVSWCSAAGLSVEIDELGNIFATRAGSEPGLAPVFIGSHLDTQINGGRFDGIAGVLAGLELIRTLNDNQLSTRRSLVLVNWTGEEGSRFKPTMVASGAYVGFFDTQWVKEQIAFDGARFADELKRIGYDGNKPCKAGAIDAYFELHIEQGPLLDAENKQLGIVTGGYVSHRLEVTFKGKTAHPGPTPMDRRSNALAAAARWLTAVDDIGWQFSIGDGKSTASSLNVL